MRLSSREALAASDVRSILESRMVEPRREWTESLRLPERPGT